MLGISSIKRLFKKKLEQKEELDIKPLIAEFINKGMFSSIKEKKVIENAGFILNTLFESKTELKDPMKVMGFLLKIKKKIGIDKKAIVDIQKLLSLFLKFMDKKGLIPEDMKIKMKDIYSPPLTIKREGPKIGRNEPCHCGSMKKYKLCCGR